MSPRVNVIVKYDKLGREVFRQSEFGYKCITTYKRLIKKEEQSFSFGGREIVHYDESNNRVGLYESYDVEDKLYLRAYYIRL